MNEDIFREYDIRGIADKDLTDQSVEDIASAYATYSHKYNIKKICIGRDCRLSSDRIFKTLSQKLIKYGISIIDIGLVTTPILYYCLHCYDVDGGIMITASHNPSDYNGFKAAVGINVLSSEQIQKLKFIIQRKNFIPESAPGQIYFNDPLESYIQDLKERVNIQKKLKVGLDCANTPIGLFAKKVFDEFGCETFAIFEEPDGTFPNHHPDPSVESNLDDLKKLVLKKKLDIGIAFDGDGDRIGVLDGNGVFINADIVLLILAKSILVNNPNAKIIGEVKCSKVFFDEVENAGGQAIMWKTGHSKIKEKIKDEDALLAGELSGHIFFKDNHYGYDDALFAALRLIETISSSNESLSEMIDKIPSTASTPEIRIDFPEDKKFAAIDKLIKEVEKDLRDFKVTKIDGMRIEDSTGWALVRASNTQPALTLRFESDSNKNLLVLKEYIKDKIHKSTGLECKL